MLASIYRKKGEVVTRRIAGETLLVPVKAKLADMRKVFVLQGAGEFIWAEIDGKKSLTNVLEGITRDYDVKADVAEKDLCELVSDMLKAGLIEKII